MIITAKTITLRPGQSVTIKAAEADPKPLDSFIKRNPGAVAAGMEAAGCISGLMFYAQVLRPVAPATGLGMLGSMVAGAALGLQAAHQLSAAIPGPVDLVKSLFPHP